MKRILRQLPGARLLLSRMHEDEQGTTITEFVIVLPVFVIIFSATLALSKMQHVGIETQIRASSQMWERAIEVQTDTDPMPDPNHLSAQNADYLVAREDPDYNARAIVENVATQASAQGHMGEAQAMLTPVEDYVEPNFGLDSYSKLFQAHTRYNEAPMGVANSVRELFDASNTQRAAFNLLNDAGGLQALPTSGVQQAGNHGSLYPLLDSTTPEGTIYSSAAGIAGASRIALATGLRYGVVEGRSEIEVVHPLLPGDPELKAGFVTLIAPKAQITDQERARTNYISHMTLMSETLYSTVLAIEYDENFTYDESY